VIAGELYDASFTFEPSITSSPNPEIKLAFTTQHALPSGSQIEITIPLGSNELAPLP